MYDYAIYDAQWLLARNYFAIRGSSENKLSNTAYGSIVSSVLRSIIKMNSEVPARKIILLWDTYPYHKHTILSGDYKSSRLYTTEDDVENAENEEERLRLEIDAHNLHQRGKSKWILKDLSSYGLPSIFKSGYEADDLAFLISRKFKDSKERIVLVTVDTDWSYFTNDNVDWYSPKRGLSTYEDIKSDINLPSDLELFEYKRLYSSFYGSHDDYYNTVTDENYKLSFVEFYSKYKNNEPDLFSDKSLFEKQYYALKIENYPEYNKVNSILYYMDSMGSIPSRGTWEAFRVNNLIQVSDTEYFKLIDSFDHKLFN